MLGVFHSVGLAVGDDDGGVVQEAVEDAASGGVLGQEATPAMWSSHMFVVSDSCC